MTKHFSAKFLVCALLSLSAIIGGCTVSAKNQDENERKIAPAENAVAENPVTTTISKAKIKINAGSPADAVRLFYKNLREKRFREAMMMTNLRVAVEGLSEEEMKDLSTDFEPLAAQVPAELEINGEIIAGNSATVTAKMPNEDTGALELKEIKLRQENNNWIILTADEDSEAKAKKEGKNYFFAVRLEIHHLEAQDMMERIIKAEMVYAMQNGGAFTDMQTLVKATLLPEDAQSSATTGYRYEVKLASDKRKYTATAEPATYGKTGKLSYSIEVDAKGNSTGLKSRDAKSASAKN